MISNLPVVGFSAYSGTGKTTLLTGVIPQLKSRGLKVAVIKHAHHHFDLDQPGKDSYELRKAGADQTVICTHTRMAVISEFDGPAEEPSLEQIIESLNPAKADLVLVEGYKHLEFAKIELHRKALGKPYLYPDDPAIIAIACDATPSHPTTIPVLDINDPKRIAEFIYQQIYLGGSLNEVGLPVD
ncbi:MAG: molybdopterin-guanine dinucleotide biosynthesis protein B [Gammaproteobacteria bacterium]